MERGCTATTVGHLIVFTTATSRRTLQATNNGIDTINDLLGQHQSPYVQNSAKASNELFMKRVSSDDGNYT
jgi:hypothetical protein